MEIKSIKSNIIARTIQEKLIDKNAFGDIIFGVGNNGV